MSLKEILLAQLTEQEYSAVTDTILEEIDACERIWEEDNREGPKPERAVLLESALRKMTSFSERS